MFFVEDLIHLVICLAIIALVLYFGAIALDKCAMTQCESRGRMINMEVQYNTSTGCMVKTEQGWISYENLVFIKNKEDKQDANP